MVALLTTIIDDHTFGLTYHKTDKLWLKAEPLMIIIIICIT